MKKYKILLVDDDLVFIKNTILFLEQKGYFVFTASNWNIAIGLLLNTEFDLVLSDLAMPGIDNFQVLKKAKKIYSGIMVIVMAGFNNVKVAIDCLQCGADDYIIKSCGPEEMLFRVKNCFERLEKKKKLKN